MKSTHLQEVSIYLVEPKTCQYSLGVRILILYTRYLVTKYQIYSIVVPNYDHQVVKQNVRDKQSLWWERLLV